MKFMMTFSFKTESRDAALARYKETGGQPPKGVMLLGRWMRADFSYGFCLLETDDAGAITEFALMWNDIVDLMVVPVVEDPEIVAAVGRAGL